eukprot:5799078-Amphidinium_carterae.1
MPGYKMGVLGPRHSESNPEKHKGKEAIYRIVFFVSLEMRGFIVWESSAHALACVFVRAWIALRARLHQRLSLLTRVLPACQALTVPTKPSSQHDTNAQHGQVKSFAIWPGHALLEHLHFLNLHDSQAVILHCARYSSTAFDMSCWDDVQSCSRLSVLAICCTAEKQAANWIA